MSISNELLAKFERLGLREFEIGDTVGRGFADVGYEEFTVIADSKLLSLYTGKSAQISEADRKFIFRVLAVDEMVVTMRRRGAQIAISASDDGREWHAEARMAGRSFNGRGTLLQEALVELLIAAKGDADARA